MSTETFFCIPCNKTLYIRNQTRHLKSKGHATKSLRYFKKHGVSEVPEVPEVSVAKPKLEEEKKIAKETFDCSICMEEYHFDNISVKLNVSTCQRCNQSWCKNCNKKLHTCPFCRNSIPGHEHILQREIQERIREEQRVLREQLIREHLIREQDNAFRRIHNDRTMQVSNSFFDLVFANVNYLLERR